MDIIGYVCWCKQEIDYFSILVDNQVPLKAKEPLGGGLASRGYLGKYPGNQAYKPFIAYLLRKVAVALFFQKLMIVVFKALIAGELIKHQYC